MESEITASSTFPGVGPGKGSTSQPPASLLGQTVGGYVIERVLGEGSTSTVYLGKHARLGTTVAIKVSDTDQVATRLEAEARATVAIDDPHVVRALDIGELADGRQFAVMTYAHGRPLSRVIASEGPFTVAETRAVLSQTAQAMAVAHRAGIVHRDLKPANLLLDSKSDGEGFVRILDLGSAKRVGSCDGAADREAFVGTPAYCAPEQIRGERVGFTADVYALGAIAHEMLRGKPLWAGAVEDVLARKLVEDAVAIGRADVPPSLEALIMRMVARDRCDRPESMDEVLVLLEESAPSSATTRARSKRLTKRALVAGAAAGAVIVVALIAAMRPADPRASESNGGPKRAVTVVSASQAPARDERADDFPPPPPLSTINSAATAAAVAPSTAPAPRLVATGASSLAKPVLTKPAASSAARPASAAPKGTLVDPFSR